MHGSMCASLCAQRCYRQRASLDTCFVHYLHFSPAVDAAAPEKIATDSPIDEKSHTAPRAGLRRRKRNIRIRQRGERKGKNRRTTTVPLLLLRIMVVSYSEVRKKRQYKLLITAVMIQNSTFKWCVNGPATFVFCRGYFIFNVI
jgi:hypothetical protein